MKKLLILGAGTAGTMVANRLSHELDPSEWQITIVDQDEVHYYQPGFLFIPFGTYAKADVVKPKRDYLPMGIEIIISEIEAIESGPQSGSHQEGQSLPQLRLSHHCHRIAHGSRRDAGTGRA